MESFMPHGYCLSWNPQLVILFVVGNSLVALAYYSIPTALAVIFTKRKDLVFNWMFMLFAAFILACGTTHLIKIWTIWHANYWLEAIVDAGTGVLSLITAVLLWNLVPKVLALPSLKQLMSANSALNEQIAQREKVEQKFRELLEQLKDQKEELARSNSELQRFAYVAAHDLREPLRTIVSYTDLLAEEYKGKLSPDTEENMGFIVDAGKRMQQMISDLLTYSRVETQKHSFTQTDCNLIFDQTIASLKASIEEADGQVTCDPLPTLTADASQLGQLFLNLLGNALKFRGKEPPQIHVSAKQLPDEWLFSIQDNGIGIDINFSDRVFQMFQRLHGMSDYPGTGIGLAVCRKIVERHHGRIWFESRGEQPGTIFYFTLPANKATAA